MPETTQFGGLYDNSANDGALTPNTILLARYKIDGQLGGGGQGAVYQARDLNFPDAKRLVAIKEMLVTTADPNLRAATLKSFQREANILATLTHPAIPKIYDFFNQNERAYLVMEYINGRDLEAILVKTKKLPMKRIIEWGIELCDVLGYLHSHQPDPIIFRDMKPANVMIDALGKVRLIDFGIAKIFDASNVKHTMIGTEGYSAPEQYKGKASPLSDIYGLGATMHHILTRDDPRLETPFSFAERLITQRNPEATPELAAIIEKAIEFEPDNRWQTCEAMKEALEAVRYGGSVVVQTGASSMAAADSNNQEMAAGGQPRNGTSMLQGAVGIEPVWTFEAEDEIRSSPVVFNDTVYVGSYDTNIYAVKLDSGEMIWNRSTDGGIAATPAIDVENRQVLFGSEDYTFSAVDQRDGRMNWTHTTKDKLRGTARMAHGYAFFGSDDGRLYALIAANGRYQWEYEAGAPIRSRPYVTSDRIIFGTEGGEVIGLELNGSRKWSMRIKKSVQSSPIVDREGMCYVGAFDGFLYAIDTQNGYSQWRYRTLGPIIASPALMDEFVYITSTDGKLYCINTQTGRERWSLSVDSPIVSSPTVHNDVVYFGGTNNKLYAVDAKTGKENWSFTAGAEITSTPFVANDLILFGSLDCKLYALPLIAQ